MVIRVRPFLEQEIRGVNKYNPNFRDSRETPNEKANVHCLDIDMVSYLFMLFIIKIIKETQ